MKTTLLLLTIFFVADTVGAGGQQIIAEFKPLTTWEKIKLGAAYYTSPNVTQYSDFAYEYDGKLWMSFQYEDKLKELASRRIIVCGKFDEKERVIKEIPCASFEPQHPDNKIISSSPSLFGQKPTDVVTTRDAYSYDGK